MNQEKHWNTIGTAYKDEIFDVFASDKNKILPKYFQKHANKKHTAIDFGCGIGKAFPHLSPLFKKVIGTDISARLLNQAKKLPYTNISLIKADLSKPDLKFPKVDFAFCCNVIMLPEIEKNYTMFKNIQRSLKPGGHALLVLPSIESMMFASWRLIDWYQKEGVALDDIPNSELAYFKSPKKEILRGNVHINGVPTKHYAAPELEVILQEAGFQVKAIKKIEYDWNTEFSTVPDWMKSPYPWDWLVECKKVETSLLVN
jgi:ubiquinone/menaquinone biosynthesis C-methylase UbiE